MELIDINGLYTWDNTIFDNMVIPSDVVKSELIDMIIWECRELTVTVVSPTIMKRAIELWSKKNIYYWNELQKTMHYQYNPIENYDRHEKTTDKFKNNNTVRETGNSKIEQNGQTVTEHTGNSTDVQSGTKTTTNVQSGTKTTTDALTRSAYDSNTELPRETHTITETPTDYTNTVTETPTDYTVTTTPNLTDTTTPNLQTIETPNLTNTNNSSGDNDHESYVHGNIGVMSTQNMIEQQRSIINISLYSVIVNSFKNEFCILKY